MKQLYIVALFILLIPFVASAQSAAGFATQSIFLSTETPVAGERISVYASVFNTSTSTFSGAVRFEQGGSAFGTMPITLQPGQAVMASAYWTPSAGQQTIEVALQNARGQTVASESQVFAVAKPYASQATASGIYDSIASSTQVEPAEPIVSAVASVSPTAARAIKPILGGIDAARTGIADFLSSQIDVAHGNLPTTSIGFVPKQASPGGILHTAEEAGWTLYFYLLVALRFIVAQFIIFYPLLVFLFFWLLYKLYRHMSRPSWQR
ncbi:MAG: hypothetical protein ACREGH_03490 [Minisyncoccia bacterium]